MSWADSKIHDEVLRLEIARGRGGHPGVFDTTARKKPCACRRRPRKVYRYRRPYAASTTDSASEPKEVWWTVVYECPTCLARWEETETQE